MKAITIFNGEGLFSFQSLVNLCEGHIRSAQADRTYLTRFNSPKWFLSELFCILKKQGEIPEMDRERKLELWREAGKDKLLYLSFCLIEII